MKIEGRKEEHHQITLSNLISLGISVNGIAFSFRGGIIDSWGKIKKVMIDT